MPLLRTLLLWLALVAIPGLAHAQSMQEVIGAGDTLRISAFRYPELTTEARVSEEGQVKVPLIGAVALQGLTPDKAAALIAERLKRGNYVLDPEINVAVLQARSRQVSVLGHVTRPGRYTLDGASARLSDVVAMAGGLVPAASDILVVKSADFDSRVPRLGRGVQILSMPVVRRYSVGRESGSACGMLAAKPLTPSTRSA